MTDAASSFELLEFEQVQAGSRTVLLRLAARPLAGVTVDGLTLIVDGDREPGRLSPLPAPPGAGDLIRAAFSATPELLERASGYSLEFGDGSIVPLRAPIPRSATRRPTPPPSPPIEHPDAPRLAEAEQRAASRRLAIVELQRRLSAEHSRRAAAEAEARTARAAATAEAAAHVELRTRLADTEAESERARAALDEAARAAAAEAQAAATLSQQVSDLESELESARVAHQEALETELAAVRAAHNEELESAANSAEELRARLVELELRLEDEQARLEAAESDVQVGREQFAGVEAELAGVRAAAEEVAAALADRTTEVELLREAALARDGDGSAADGPAAGGTAADGTAATPVGAPEPVAGRPESLALVADALLARTAEVELLRLATAARPEPVLAEPLPDTAANLAELEQRLADAESEAAAVHERLDAAEHETVEAHRELADVREQLTGAETDKADLQQRLDQAIAARDLPPEAQAYERELVELRGAVERAQNRARLHRQHSSSLELELTEAKQELTELRHQVQAVTSSDEVAPPEEVEALREQVAYGEALAADLEWHLEEARVTEEAADAALAIRAAEVELLLLALRQLSANGE